MKAKMMRAKLKNQFAADFCCGSSVFHFFDVLTFPFAGKSFFFALLRADTPGR